MSARPIPADPVAESHHLVRQIEWPAGTNLESVREALRTLGATGQLTVNFASGGVCSMTFKESQRIEFDAK